MADIFDRCGSFIADQRLASPEDIPVARKVLFECSPIENAGPYIVKNGRRMTQFSTNDYLGMSRHPEVMRVAAEYAAKYGIGAPMGARPLSGTTELHLEFERQVAEFKRTESAIVFTMGAGAMMGSVACLARPGDLLILDQFAHASLVAGSKIAGATVRYFRHNDLRSLERILVQADPEVPKLIIVDGVYSMNADIAPLKEICDLKDQYGARLFVDDAHGNGVCGDHGRGVAEMLDVEDRIDIHAGTFSKAFGTSGGFIAAAEAIIFYIRCLAPTLLFTKAPSAVVTAATMKSLELVKEADDRRAKVWDNARYLQGQLRDRGFDIGTTCTPITPIQFRGNTALHLSHILRHEFALNVSPAVYPAVPRNAAIIRIVPTAMHSHDDIDNLVDSLVKAKEMYEAGRVPAMGEDEETA